MAGAKRARPRGLGVRRIIAWSLGLGVLLSLAAVVAFAPTAAASACNPVPHAPILITSNADFTAANGVVSGKGTAKDPYVIANLQFSQMPSGYGLKVDNSQGAITVYFNVSCVQSNFKLSAPLGSTLVWLVDVRQATTVSAVMANAGEAGGSVGIRLDGSSAITLLNENINKFGNDGVQINGSDHIAVLESKLKAFHNGLTIASSSYITVGQSCNINSANGCNEFTYDDGRGIDIEDSHNVAVLDTITSADDTGGILIDGAGSYAITLTGGIASADGPICPSGTPTGQVADTIAGVAVTNGAHDITMTGYTLNANGDGYGGFFDMMDGGNGGYMNPCDGSITLFGQSTPPGGANLEFNGNCYHFEFGFPSVPTVFCATS